MVAHIRTPVTDPVWSNRTQAIFALAEDGSAVSRIRPASIPGSSQWPQAVSSPIPDLGRNLVADAAGDDNLYVPRPGADRVTVISEATLRPVADLPGGSDPSYVAVDSGSDHLLVLGSGGSTVTPVDLHSGAMQPTGPVSVAASHTVEGAKRGRRIDFYVVGPDGIAHYKWTFGQIHETGRLPVRAGDSAGDLVKSSRLYVAVRGTGRLLAVDVNRGGQGLSVVASARLDGVIRYVATDEMRVYAATNSTLYVFASNSYGGFPDGMFALLDRVDFRAPLAGTPGASATLTGMAVGTDRVFLSLKAVPEMLSIGKPQV